MTIVIKSSDEKHISIPASLMAQLNLREGEEVKAVVDGNTLRLERIDKLLKLRGVLANNPAFDQAMEYLERAWKAWTPPDFVHFSRVPGLGVITPEEFLSTPR